MNEVNGTLLSRAKSTNGEKSGFLVDRSHRCEHKKCKNMAQNFAKFWYFEAGRFCMSFADSSKEIRFPHVKIGSVGVKSVRKAEHAFQSRLIPIILIILMLTFVIEEVVIAFRP